jgi:hypothetical protein
MTISARTYSGKGTTDTAALLEVSDLLDGQLRMRLAAYRDGYQAGELAHADDYGAGYVAAIADAKRVQHKMVLLLAPAGAAWLDAVKRHGGTEYGGAGRPRVPVDPAAIELATMRRAA